jgi:hypothetical protein
MTLFPVVIIHEVEIKTNFAPARGPRKPEQLTDRYREFLVCVRTAKDNCDNFIFHFQEGKSLICSTTGRNLKHQETSIAGTNNT